jgi:hypothetical protein
MKTLLTITFIYLLNVAGCSKNDDPIPPSNQVGVTAEVLKEGVTTGSSFNYYWAAKANISNPIPDSSVVIIQWDIINGSSVGAGTMKDTVRIGISQCCSIIHRSGTIAPNSYTAINVRVIGAWSKSGVYTFIY